MRSRQSGSGAVRAARARALADGTIESEAAAIESMRPVLEESVERGMRGSPVTSPARTAELITNDLLDYLDAYAEATARLNEAALIAEATLSTAFAEEDNR
jgi:hypothetical protein